MKMQTGWAAAMAAALAVTGCHRAGDEAATMTSFSATESAASKAELFSLPADQLARIKLYKVAKAPLAHTLRLSGSVAYNNFLTTPVITQVGGPVNRIVVTPGEHVRAGQPMQVAGGKQQRDHGTGQQEAAIQSPV